MGVWKVGEQADGAASNVCLPPIPQAKAGSRRGPGMTEARGQTPVALPVYVPLILSFPLGLRLKGEHTS